MKKARIYVPTKTAMQSARGNSKKWLLEFSRENCKFIEPVMGWTGSTDTVASEVKMFFATCEEAKRFARENNIEYELIEPKKPKLKIKSYADNFKF